MKPKLVFALVFLALLLVGGNMVAAVLHCENGSYPLMALHVFFAAVALDSFVDRLRFSDKRLA